MPKLSKLFCQMLSLLILLVVIHTLFSDFIVDLSAGDFIPQNTSEI